VPEPRGDAESGSPAAATAASGNGRTPPVLPYGNGAVLALHLIRKMSDTEFDKMLDILNEHRAKRDADRAVPAAPAEGR
jgi:ParB family chromosome partitioning protein